VLTAAFVNLVSHSNLDGKWTFGTKSKKQINIADIIGMADFFKLINIDIVSILKKLISIHHYHERAFLSSGLLVTC